MRTDLVRSCTELSLTHLGDASIIDQDTKSRSGSFTKISVETEKPKQTVGSTLNGLCSQFCTQKRVHRSFPIFKWLPDYTFGKLVSDLIAAITVTITMLPQGLAYATIADMPPEYGLYSCFVGSFVHIIFGSAPKITIGPTAILAILANTYTNGMDRRTVVMLTFLMGFVSFVIGALNLGFIVNFISKPVSAGFITAAALTICSTQFKEALGLTINAQGFINVLYETVKNIADTKLPDLILTICTIFVLVFMKELPLIFSYIGLKKDNVVIKFLSVARNSLVVIVTTAVVTAYSEVQPFSVIKEVKSDFPPIAFPPFEIYNETSKITYSFLSDIVQKNPSSIIVLPLLAFMEHISIAKALSEGEIVDSSQEIISLGLSNMIGSCFSSIPITGSFSLTTVNASSGARTPLCGLFTGSFVILAILYFTPYFYYIPKGSLAAVIICAVIFMIDLGVIRAMWNSKKMELIPYVLTISLSLFLGLQFGMMAGILISVTYLLYYAARPGVRIKRGFTSNETEFTLVTLDRSLTFPSVEYIRYIVAKASRNLGINNKTMVIDCHHIQYADFTAAQALCDLIHMFNKKDQLIILWDAKHSIVRVLEGVDAEAHVVLDETELENIIDARWRKTLRNSIDIPTINLESHENESYINTTSTINSADPNY